MPKILICKLFLLGTKQYLFYLIFTHLQIDILESFIDIFLIYHFIIIQVKYPK